MATPVGARVRLAGGAQQAHAQLAAERAPAALGSGRTGAVAALSLVVAVVLGDSGVVTLALPEILRDFGAEVGEVAWVLIAFNLVLALVAVPAARACACAGIRPWPPPVASSASPPRRPCARWRRRWAC